MPSTTENQQSAANESFEREIDTMMIFLESQLLTRRGLAGRYKSKSELLNRKSDRVTGQPSVIVIHKI